MIRYFYNYPVMALSCLLLLLISSSGNAFAVDAEDTRLNLHLLQVEQMTLEKNKKETSLKLESEHKKLESIQKKLVSQANQTKKIEQRLTQKENELSQIIDEIDLLSSVLNIEQKSYANMLLALQRIERTPPSVMLGQPGEIIQTARTQTVLSSLIPQIRQKSTEIAALVSQHQAIKKIFIDEKQALLKEQEKHIVEQEKLRELLDERKAFFTRYKNETEKLKEKTQKISKRVNSLKSLMNEIDQTEMIFASLFIPKKPEVVKAKENDKKFLSSATTKSSILPAAGSILTGFNKKNDLGITNKGIDIKTRAGAIVISPLSGRVKFAGPFKSYENIVIIEHTNKKLSLLGGMETINVDLGQDIKAGEPIGNMSRERENNILYYELRDQGKQIDPEKYLWALAKKQQRT